MLLERIEQVAQYDFVNVLLIGETGVGKTYYAKFIHQNSIRRNRPFISINCAALPRELIETELFGVEKGAFTGAIPSMGKFEAAEGGTVFLDEVGELEPKIQAKLLAVLEDKTIRRVGSNKSRVIDVRFIFATNQDVSVFRSDFLYRIASFSIKIPPLRERKPEIRKFIQHFLQMFNLENKQQLGFAEEVFEFLEQQEWYGNLRELKNYVHQLCLFGLLEETSRISSLQLEKMPELAFSKPPEVLMPETIPHFSFRNQCKCQPKPSIEKAIQLYQERKLNVAEILAKTGVNRATFYRHLGKFAINI